MGLGTNPFWSATPKPPFIANPNQFVSGGLIASYTPDTNLGYGLYQPKTNAPNVDRYLGFTITDIKNIAIIIIIIIIIYLIIKALL